MTWKKLLTESELSHLSQFGANDLPTFRDMRNRQKKMKGKSRCEVCPIIEAKLTEGGVYDQPE